MARNDSADSEFDPEMERILRQHFDSESPDLRSPNDPWPWLESRMEEPLAPSFFRRLLGLLNPLREGRLSPAFAVAGVAVVAVVITAAALAVSSNGSRDPDGQLAVMQESEERESAATASPFTTARNGATTAPQAAAERVELSSGPAETGSDRSQATSPVSSAAQAAAPAATVAPTAVAMAESEDAPTRVEQATAVPRPAPTQVLTAQATTAPAPTRGPVPVTRIAGAPETATPSPQMAMAAAEADATMARSATGTTGRAGPREQAGGTPPDATFRDYQRQPFVAASEDNVSTFSLDTDRTSFHLALSWARAGYEIDPDSVRAEEWLNAFDYRYDPPSRNDEFAILADLLPHPLEDDRRLARIAFQAPELVDDRPLNVTLVLDASGSMADGNRVDIARSAAETIRQSLRPNDRIAVVHFTNDVIDQYTVEHTHPNDDRVLSSIAWLQPHASTNVQAGLNLGVELAAEAREERPDAYNYVILMSDGVANVDATDPFAILEMAYDADARNPLRLITIGVGINNYNDPLLEQLAQHGNGWYRYLDSTAQAQATFARENWLTLSVPFADQTRAQVTWNTETVERWRIIGYENRVTADENFTQNRREFAEIHSGAATTVLYELELTESAKSSPWVNLGGVEVRWVDPSTAASHSQSADLSGDPASEFPGNDGDLASFAAIVALAADLYGGLPAHPEGTYPEVHQALASLQSRLGSLAGALGTLDAYNDFAFLLDHIAEGVEDRLLQPTRTGYSR